MRSKLTSPAFMALVGLTFATTQISVLAADKPGARPVERSTAVSERTYYKAEREVAKRLAEEARRGTGDQTDMAGKADAYGKALEELDKAYGGKDNVSPETQAKVDEAKREVERTRQELVERHGHEVFARLDKAKQDAVASGGVDRAVVDHSMQQLVTGLNQGGKNAALRNETELFHDLGNAFGLKPEEVQAFMRKTHGDNDPMAKAKLADAVAPVEEAMKSRGNTVSAGGHQRAGLVGADAQTVRSIFAHAMERTGASLSTLKALSELMDTSGEGGVKARSEAMQGVERYMAVEAQGRNNALTMIARGVVDEKTVADALDKYKSDPLVGSRIAATVAAAKKLKLDMNDPASRQAVEGLEKVNGDIEALRAKIDEAEGKGQDTTELRKQLVEKQAARRAAREALVAVLKAKHPGSEKEINELFGEPAEAGYLAGLLVDFYNRRVAELTKKYMDEKMTKEEAEKKAKEEAEGEVRNLACNCGASDTKSKICAMANNWGQVMSHAGEFTSLLSATGSSLATKTLVCSALVPIIALGGEAKAHAMPSSPVSPEAAAGLSHSGK